MELNDPIGAAAEAYLNGEADAEITVESNITEDDVIPASYLFRTWDEMPELENIALEHCSGIVLDVGAGVGTHSLELQKKGLEVTAVDVSEKATAIMRERGVQHVLRQDVLQMEGQKYTTLLMLMNGIGIVGNLEGLERFLEHAKKLLLPGGQILLESADILYMYEEEDGSVLLDLNAGYYGEITYNMKYGNHESGPFKWLYIDADLLQNYAVMHGYSFEVLYDGEYGNYLAKLKLQH
ncbi:class I SAM-dependent methyltransferase [Pontibacter harenae]|uniref:class I SAM-dependent methyltransferase n=1 Tax=Pontibacter harenae TaxID=2894083 RepID=UPI001E30674D|nr:class I SAM-dependent methyltransferase [Pontibacter harenae]MCC9166607.1 class I SAM-dependent methyltransferase [Pontibacter harenae]